ncbi:MAG: hypothetical protein IPG87_02715 [Saprospiraceae bacterium]|nr:hypothetical protein [Candidatus Vicinibacter affinis]
MKRIILLFGFILFVSSVYAQNLSCDQLNSTIKSKGSKKRRLSLLMNCTHPGCRK